MSRGDEKLQLEEQKTVIIFLERSWLQPGMRLGVCKQGGEGGVKIPLRNTCEGVHLIIKLPAISLQACKFTKNELLHTYFSRILARF